MILKCYFMNLIFPNIIFVHAFFWKLNGHHTWSWTIIIIIKISTKHFKINLFMQEEILKSFISKHRTLIFPTWLINLMKFAHNDSIMIFNCVRYFWRGCFPRTYWNNNTRSQLNNALSIINRFIYYRFRKISTPDTRRPSLGIFFFYVEFWLDRIVMNIHLF